jgi:putative DNA-invertase from lambdoid prophage Rac
VTTAIYYRVSSAQQTVANQKPDVERYVQAQGLGPVTVYEEQASAAKRRPEFERMLAACRDGHHSTVVVWALDRFGRSMAGNVRDVLELDRLGVRVVSVREPWLNTAGPVRELLVAIFSWVAQQERQRLIERTKAGLATAKAKGKQIGTISPVAPREPEARAAVVQAWRAETGGKSVRRLAEMLGGVSTATAARLAREWPAADPQQAITAASGAPDSPEFA